MSSLKLEQGLSAEPSYVPKAIPDMINEARNSGNASRGIALLERYLAQLKAELSHVKASEYLMPQAVFMLENGIRSLEYAISRTREGMQLSNLRAPRSNTGNMPMPAVNVRARRLNVGPGVGLPPRPPAPPGYYRRLMSEALGEGEIDHGRDDDAQPPWNTRSRRPPLPRPPSRRRGPTDIAP